MCVCIWHNIYQIIQSHGVLADDATAPLQSAATQQFHTRAVIRIYTSLQYMLPIIAKSHTFARIPIFSHLRV